MNRRQFLGAAGTFTVAGVAGCVGSRSDTGEPDPPASIDGEWPLPSYDAGRTYYTPESTGPTAPVSELWRTDLDTEPAALVIADETVFSAGEGTVRALDAIDGTRAWDRPVPSDSSVHGAVDDHLYLAGSDHVIALDLEDGAERWRESVTHSTDAVVTPEGVYVLTDDEVLGVRLLGPEDGAERWRTELDLTAHSAGILAHDRNVIAWGAGDVGHWWVLDGESGDLLVERGGGTHGALPRAARDGIVYGTDPFYGFVQASPLDGGESWQTPLNAYGPADLPVTATPDRLYARADEGDEPGVYALDTEGGEILWHFDSGDSNRVVACEEIVLISTDETLQGLDPDEGKEQWAVDIDEIGWFGVVDDLVYAVQGREVIALRHP